MKRALILAVVVTSMGFFGAVAYASPASAAGWTAHHLDLGPLLSVAAPDAGHAWAVGPAPSIVTTSNGGASWRSQDPGTTDQLYCVAFSDAADGWAVGDAGTIVATTDGGAHWAPQTAPATTAALIGLASHGADAWAVGGGGLIVATTDGGTTWLSQTSSTTTDLYSVSFSDATHGWAVGDAGTIVATTDGGATWTAQQAHTGNYLNGVTSSGELRAWAVGQGGIILATTDGGAHWTVTRRPAAKAPDLYTVSFADSHRGWAVGDAGVLLATTNGGLTWRVQPTPAGSEALASVAFPDALHGFVSGVAGAMLTTAHAGWSDTRPPTATAAGLGWHRSAATITLHAVDPASGSGVASLAHSFNHGATWTTGSSFVVAAPADHSKDGLHSFLFRATDNAGNVAPARRALVGIDTSRPTPLAPYVAIATRGARATLRFRIADRRPGAPTATVTIRVRNARGALMKKLVMRGVKVDAPLSCSFTCTLPAGTYRFAIAAVDAAGNPQAVQARNTLRVQASTTYAGPR